MKKLLKKNGVAFLTSVALMFILLMMGMSFLLTTRTTMEISRNQFDALRALYFAESGLEHSIGELLANSDTGVDGIGVVDSFDIDGDGTTDYVASYDSFGGTITSYGFEGSGYRTVIADVSTGPWSGAFQVGGNIGVAGFHGRTINGNVDAVGSIAGNINNYTINGTVTASNASLTIPTTDTLPTGPWFGYSDFQHTDCAWLTNSPAPGVHYVDGDCIYDAGNTGPFSLSGSLIVNGNLRMQSINTGFTIIPSGSDPALVASGDIDLITVWTVTTNGLIYAGNDIRFTTWNLPINHDITGAVVAGGDFDITSVDRVTYTFDSGLNPPFFSGGSGGGVTVTSWKGHP